MNVEKDVIDRLNNLIQLDVDAVHAYKQAIEACDSSVVKQELTVFQSDHERHIDELSVVVRGLGAEPTIERDAKGFVIEAFTSIMSHGDHSALLAMRGNEELTTKTYQSALDSELPDAALDVVRRNFQDEQRHLAWIKNALDTEIWKTEGGVKAA